MGSTIFLSAVVLIGIGLILGAAIGVVYKFFEVPVDPRVELLLELLPGVNCGGCGRAGCADFARALIGGEAAPAKCPVASQEVVAQLAQVLGVEIGRAAKQVAVILCGGDLTHAKGQMLYNGVDDCISASQVAGGPKGCRYGCLGMGSCARACPFEAIGIVNGLAVVHNEYCVGCGKCVDVCPRGLVKLVPVDAKVHIYCKSPEKAPAKMKVCDIPCIGCRKCVKAADEGQFTVNGFLVEVNYGDYPRPDVIEKAKCPKNCLQTCRGHEEFEYGKSIGESA